MNKKTKLGIAGAAGAAIVGGALWLGQQQAPTLKPKPRVEPECASNISYPDKLDAKLVSGTPKDGRWEASVAVRPPNAPCYIWYVPVATDDKGAKSLRPEQSTIIHIK